MKKLMVGFFAGAMSGSLFFSVPNPFYSKPTPLESSLAQIAYERLDKYLSHIDFDKILTEMKQISQDKVPLKDEKALYEPIMELEDQLALQTLQTSRQMVENFLKDKQKKPNVQTIIPDRVFVEVLKEGNGEPITLDSVVSLQYKEYAIDGTLIKDTQGKAFSIPLKQTIKGFQLGLTGAKVGETRKIYVHPEYGYGKRSYKAAHKMLIYEVTLIEKIS